jgi:heme-degrading monooxygenase HmoA
MFVLIWRYCVPPSNREAFMEAYGPSGVWADLFATGDGYIRTELLQDPADETSFMTLDFWESGRAFQTFQEAHQAAYRNVDAMCEDITGAETFVGGFELASADARARILWVDRSGTGRAP